MDPWSMLLVCLLAATAAVDGQWQLDDRPTVQISQGVLRGAAHQTADGTRYYKFLGIPYAKPPLGELRFAAPQHPEPWSGVRDATNYRSTCFQTGSSTGSEDCLFVDVFTPQLPTSRNITLLPVMVYIHGGAFVKGSGTISPGQLIDHGLVVVSIKYRLNVFGFLSINGTDAPGNAGLKDQSAGLRWIQQNIAIFGGDPKSVTIFGESAGGASIHYNILSPLSKGLFHRAISESGSSLNPWAFYKNTEARAYRLAEVLGRKASNASGLLQVLRAASAGDLLRGVEQVLTPEESVRLISYPFVPSLEFHRSGEQPFLPHEPSYLEQNGLFHDVPYITGVTKREGSSFVTNTMVSQASYWRGINGDLEQVVPLDLGLAKGSTESLEVAQKVKNFYFGDEAISRNTSELWINLQTDLLFVTGVMRTTGSHVGHSTSATYNYRFVYGAAGHTAELPYLLYNGPIEGNSSDSARLARLIGQLWTSFAKTGVPHADSGVTWQPASHNHSPYLEIQLNHTLKYDLEKHRMDFWSDIYKNYSNYVPTLRDE